MESSESIERRSSSLFHEEWRAEMIYDDDGLVPGDKNGQNTTEPVDSAVK